ncbi:MAG: VCBS repeat-containing protein [Acidobacteriota bacterium]
MILKIRQVATTTLLLLISFLLAQPGLASERGWPVEGQFQWYSAPFFGRVGSPVAQDLDGDGQKEVVVLQGKYDPAGNSVVEIQVFDKDGSPFTGNWPVQIAEEMIFGNVASTGPMIANVDGSDEELEIIVTLLEPGTKTLRIYVLNHDGTFFWTTPFERTVTHTGMEADFSPGAVGDLNRDGLLEIVTAVGDEVFVIEPDKTTLFEVDLNEDDYFISSAPALADLDQDGKLEVILNFDKYYAWKYDGTSLPGWPIDIPGTLQIPAANIMPVVGDLDDDGDYEIVFSNIPAHQNELITWIYAYHHDGSVVDGWPVEDIGVGSSNRFNSPALADIDNDGKPEVITLKAGADNEVCVYHHDGTMAAGWPRAVNLSGMGSFYYIANSFTPSVGDVDGDGEVEIAVVAMDRSNSDVPAVYLFNADGTDVAGFPFPTEVYSMLASIPSMVDLDNDDRAEILFSYYKVTGASNGTVNWHVELVQDLGWQALNHSAMPWPSFQRDPHHSGTLPIGFGQFLIFADGFESGNSSQWSLSVP